MFLVRKVGIDYRSLTEPCLEVAAAAASFDVLPVHYLAYTMLYMAHTPDVARWAALSSARRVGPVEFWAQKLTVGADKAAIGRKVLAQVTVLWGLYT